MISIIIPVYNSQAYLEVCIQSIIVQTYKLWECILINDGSTDDSNIICNKWANKDKRIIVIHQTNKGVSAARNKGIDIAKGEYITFIDSDDWVTPTYLEDLITAKKSDLIISGLTRYENNHKRVNYIPSKNRTFSFNDKDISYFVELNEKFLIFGPCTKLYKTEVIKNNNIRFPESRSLGEDLEFNFKYLDQINNITTISTSNYYYRIIGSNTLTTQLRIEQFEQDYKQWKIQKSFYERNGMWSSCAKKLLYRRLWEIIHDGIFRYPKLTNANINYLKYIKSIPEITELKDYKDLYPCSKWIKWGILNRLYYLFFIYFTIILFPLKHKRNKNKFSKKL